MGDVVGILHDLRWGEIPFANLRYRNYSDWCATFMMSGWGSNPLAITCRHLGKLMRVESFMLAQDLWPSADLPVRVEWQCAQPAKPPGRASLTPAGFRQRQPDRRYACTSLALLL